MPLIFYCAAILIKGLLFIRRISSSGFLLKDVVSLAIGIIEKSESTLLSIVAFYTFSCNTAVMCSVETKQRIYCQANMCVFQQPTCIYLCNWEVYRKLY